MQGCRRSWEDKLKCVKILSVKGHNSAKICRTWIISPHALQDLWYNICTKFHSNTFKDVGGIEKTNFDVTEWQNDGMTEGRKDGMTDKAKTKCPLAILWRGHKKICDIICIVHVFLFVKHKFVRVKIYESVTVTQDWENETWKEWRAIWCENGYLPHPLLCHVTVKSN